MRYSFSFGWNQISLTLGRLGLIYNSNRQGQQMRTDFELRSRRGREINLKPQRLTAKGKRQNAASLQKVGGLADSQYVRAFQCLQNFRVALELRLADKRDLASAEILVLMHPADVHPPAMRSFTSGPFRQRSAEGEIPSHTDDQGSLR